MTVECWQGRGSAVVLCFASAWLTDPEALRVCVCFEQPLQFRHRTVAIADSSGWLCKHAATCHKRDCLLRLPEQCADGTTMMCDHRRELQALVPRQDSPVSSTAHCHDNNARPAAAKLQQRPQTITHPGQQSSSTSESRCMYPPSASAAQTHDRTSQRHIKVSGSDSKLLTPRRKQRCPAMSTRWCESACPATAPCRNQ